jgi:hypothetical protein
MQQTRSQGRVLDALMQQKNQGHIPGILGRLVRNLAPFKLPLDYKCDAEVRRLLLLLLLIFMFYDFYT